MQLVDGSGDVRAAAALLFACSRRLLLLTLPVAVILLLQSPKCSAAACLLPALLPPAGRQPCCCHSVPALLSHCSCRRLLLPESRLLPCYFLPCYFLPCSLCHPCCLLPAPPCSQPLRPLTPTSHPPVVHAMQVALRAAQTAAGDRRYKRIAMVGNPEKRK